jgi:hypothetical protein
LGDEPKATIDVTGQPPVVRSETGAKTPGSLSTIIGANMSNNARIAYVIENGQPKCASCEEYYMPVSIQHAKMAHCGKPDCPDLNAKDLSTVEGPTAAQLDKGRDIVKEESKKNFVDMALDAFTKSSSASDLYNQGYLDAQSGKELDEDLALLSKDYYEGYTQYKFYNKTPQQSEGQSLFDIKPNSNEIPRSHSEMSRMTPGDYDRGPLELTDGIGHATAGIKDFFKKNEQTPAKPAVPQVTHGVDNHALLKTLSQIDPDMAKQYSDRLGIPLEDNSSTPEKKDASRKFSSIYPADVIEKFFGI